MLSSDETAPEELSDLYENAPCGHISIAPDGRIAKLNQTLAGWLKRPKAELLSQPFFDIISFGGRIAYETHLSPMLRLQGQVPEIALDLIDAEGQKIPVIANAIELRAPDGGRIMTRMTLFKAVQRREYEHDLLQARNQAQDAAASEQATAHLREQFIAVLGHDLRNPLAAIGGGTRLLRREALSDRGQAVLDEMAKSVERANILIDNVLDFARGRLGEGIVLNADADEPLTPVLRQVLAEIQAIAPEISLEVRLDIEEPLFCDRQRLGQLASNLLSNAVAHGDPAAPIGLEAMTVAGEFVLAVTNQGPPIPESARENLFEPFFRGAVRPSRQGLGLGLFIVSQIAEAHGGTVEVTSDDGGTRFEFRMPAGNSPRSGG